MLAVDDLGPRFSDVFYFFWWFLAVVGFSSPGFQVKENGTGWGELGGLLVIHSVFSKAKKAIPVHREEPVGVNGTGSIVDYAESLITLAAMVGITVYLPASPRTVVPCTFLNVRHFYQLSSKISCQ